MNRATVISLSCLTLSACSGDAGVMPDPDLDVSLDTAGLVQEIDHAETVYAWLKGDFDSSEQSFQDPAYFAVSLRACEAVVEELGQYVLYVEQAMLDALDRPYRQRIYSVESTSDRIASRVFTMSDDPSRQMVGACDWPEPPVLKIQSIEERKGCTVFLIPDGDDQYRGGTEGEACESALGDASYATSQVVLSERTIESWDQGWTDAGTQAWGARSGPYIFKRLKR